MFIALQSVAVFFFAYFIPGYVVLKCARTRTPLGLLLAVPVGIVIWAWQGWVFGFLQLRWLTYGYLLIMFSIFVWLVFKKKSDLYKSLLHIKNSILLDPISVVIILVGVVAQGLIVWNILQNIQGHWMSCCGDTNDNIWFAGITKSLINSVPPEVPGVSGVTLINYHYWSNLVIADLVRIFHIPQFLVQFRYSGLLLSLYLGITTICLVASLSSNIRFRRWLLFFLYFGGDFIYLIPLITTHTLNFSTSSLEDGVRFLSNLPRSYAVVLTLAWLALWVTWRKELTIRRIFLLGLILAGILSFKVYLAFFLYTGVAVVAVWESFYKRFDHIKLLFFSAILGLLVYLPGNAGAGGLYYTGFWRFENFVVQPGLELNRLELARKVFYDDGKFLKAHVFDLLFLSIYIIAIFGTKLLAFIQSKRSLTFLPLVVHIFLISALFIHFILGALFQQSTGGANSFNFIVNVYIFLSIYAAIAATNLQERKISVSLFVRQRFRRFWPVFFSIVLVVLTIPRAVSEIQLQIERTTHLYPIVSPETEQVIEYLSVAPPNSLIGVYSRYLAEDRAGPYLYIFSKQQYYNSGETILTNYNIDIYNRIRNIKFIISRSGSQFEQIKILDGVGLNYLLLDSEQAQAATLSANWLVPVVETVPITLLKIDLNRIQPSTLIP